MNTSSASKSPFETHTDDGFYLSGTLAECRRAADRLAAQGLAARVYRASDSDASIRLVYTAALSVAAQP